MSGDFYNGPGRQKRNAFFNYRAGLQRKRRRIVLRVSPGRRKKDEVFKPVDKSLILNLIYLIINVNVPMKCVFQFSLQDKKQKSTDFFSMNAFPNFHPLCSFQNSDILCGL